jgi:bla regulator protein BlaR1
MLSAILPEVLFGLWACGCAIVLIRWFRRWLRVRAAVRAAKPIPLELSVQLNIWSEVFPHPLPDGRGSVTAHPLPDGRGSVTERHASSNHSQIIKTSEFPIASLFPHPDGWGWNTRAQTGRRQDRLPHPDGGLEHEAGLKAGLPARLPAPHRIRIMSSPALIEPGIFGIFRPVLLLPEGIADRLTPAQLQSILAHELCHVKRRDNLAAAIHMIVEAAFWFHPLVWWIGARLVEERERACDEEVLLRGSEPSVYAESILQVCKFYLESPLKCVAGVTGSDLKKRIESIMSGLPGRSLTPVRKLMLIAASIGAIAGPVFVGILTAPHIRAQVAQQSAAGTTPKWEVVSVRPCDSSAPLGRSGGGKDGGFSPGTLTANCAVPMHLIEEAYGFFANGRAPTWKSVPIEGAPSWLNSERYTIAAKAESPQGRAMMFGPMMQKLLEDRFKLKIRREIREVPVYNLTIAKGGPRNLKASKPGSCVALDMDNPPPPSGDLCKMFGRRRIAEGEREFKELGVTMAEFSDALASMTGRNVIDKTGLPGAFDIEVQVSVPDEPARDPSQPRTGPQDESDLVFAVVQKLGMKLESAKGPGAVYVIEHVERPSDNFEPPVAAAQTATQPARTFDGPAPSFEVASIKRCEPGQMIAGSGVTSPGRLSTGCAPLALEDHTGLIQRAYVRFADGRFHPLGPHGLIAIAGGPAWLHSEFFAIEAKAATPESPEMMQGPMMQKLLEERFKLKVHRETREGPVYNLTLAKSKLRPVTDGSCTHAPVPGMPRVELKQGDHFCKFRVGLGATPSIDAEGSTVAEFISLLNLALDRQVIDKTGLSGRFDIHIDFAPFQSGAGDQTSDRPSIFTAVREQLGLKLDPGRGPNEFLVIDHVEKPSDNFEPPAAKEEHALQQEHALHTVAPLVAPQITVAAKPQSRPTPPAEKPPAFEVADVKINKSRSTEVEGQFLPGGQVRVRNMSMKMLITLAYHVRPNMISGGPGWLDSDRYDVVAKASPKSTEDELRVMMQTLLAERFKLKAHSEQRTLPAYALTVAAGGAKLGNPDATRNDDEDCTKVAGTGQPGEHHMVCYMGMEKLAEALPALAPGYFDRPVVDETGLAGFYKIKLDWTGALQIDALGGQTIFGAVELLGLKLDGRKIAVPTIVVDHVERKPSEN